MAFKSIRFNPHVPHRLAADGAQAVLAGVRLEARDITNVLLVFTPLTLMSPTDLQHMGHV